MMYSNKSYIVYGNSTGNNYFVKPTSLPQYKPQFSVYTSNQTNMYEETKTHYQSDKEDYEINFEDTSSFFLKDTNQPKFVGTISHLMDDIRHTLRMATNQELPFNLDIKICNEEELSKEYNQRTNNIWNQTIKGFATHGENKEIFVLADSLDKMMLTLGHEIGHILSPRLINTTTEEAKAFSFEIVWLQTIKIHNILNLAENIDLEKIGTPVANGVHDVAFRWINSFMMDGRSPKEIYNDIINGEIIICEE